MYVLNEVGESLKFKVEPAERQPLSWSDDCLELLNCPITFEIMNDPCICALDGVTYERSVITESLTKFRRSPSNNVELPAGMEVNTVLFLNRSLKALIDHYQHEKAEMKVSQAFVPHF